jgi:hypothetical protein
MTDPIFSQDKNGGTELGKETRTKKKERMSVNIKFMTMAIKKAA